MEKLNMVSENINSTVVSKYEFEESKNKNYQSEAELENEFIKTLQEQSYEYLKINSEAELILNLKLQLEKLNNYEFTDNEWNYLYNKVIKEHYQKARTRYMKNKWHKTELKIKEIKERIDKKYE